MPETQAALRLLFVSSLPRWGGRERWILQAASGLVARGHEVQVVARPGSKVLARAAEAGLRARPVHTDRALHPRTLFAMRRLLVSFRPHAVFVQLDRELASVVVGAWGGWKPLLFQKRGAHRAHLPHLHRSFLARRLTRTLTSTEYARAWVASQAGFAADTVRVVRDGVSLDVSMPSEDRAVLRRQLKLPRKPKLVLHLGMLEPGKGQETTLRALAALRASRSGAVPTVAFIGTGPEEARLHDLCHQLGVRPHVEWVGFRTNVSSYLAAAELAIVPTHDEGLSWTLLEAMAQRVPLIATATEGGKELLRDGDNVLLVPPEDPEALAAAMLRLLEQPELAAALARRGWESVCDGWNLESMLDDLESLVFAHLLRQQGGRSRAAFFVDRDDTLIRNVPYNTDPNTVDLVPGAARALPWLREAGIPVFVVSNQSGIAQGLQSEDEVRAVNERLRTLLRAAGAEVQGMYYCPHHPEHTGPCDCRKPEPGMLLRAAREHGIDLGASLMVGNAARDLEAGRRAGTAAVGFAGAGVESDLDPTETVYSSWTRLVRDFLQRRWAATR